MNVEDLMAWIKTHYVRKRDLVNSTVKVGGLALTAKPYTIASGAITISPGTGVAVVDTEGAAASDNLTTINGGEDWQLLIVRQADSGRDVTVTQSARLLLAGSTSFAMSGVGDMILLIKVGTQWRELSRSDNG